MLESIVPLYHCTRQKTLVSLSDFFDCTIVPLYQSKMLLSLADFSDCTIVPDEKVDVSVRFYPLYHCTGRKSWCLCQILAIVPLYQTEKMKIILNFKTLVSARKHSYYSDAPLFDGADGGAAGGGDAGGCGGTYGRWMSLILAQLHLGTGHLGPKDI